jgi:hypothetical protein
VKIHIAGLDLGQAQDYTALAVVESTTALHRRTYVGMEDELRLPIDRTAEVIGPPFAHRVRHLERFRLGTPYPEVVGRTADLLAKVPGALLVVDWTGVGRAVVDMLEQAGLQPYAVNITGGKEVTGSGRSWGVPKRDLVAALQVAFQAERLKIARELELAGVFVQELLNFKVKITAAANDTYGAWREGTHDDLVLAVALACWLAEQMLGLASAQQQADLSADEFNADTRASISPI